VTGSVGKLLGGPQTAIVLCTADRVARLRRHPLQRALRVDKLNLVTLEATVAGPPAPTAIAMTADPRALRQRAERLARTLLEHGVEARLVPSGSLVGGDGALEMTLPGWAVELPDRFAAALRAGDPPVVARVERERCLIDLRRVPPAEGVRLRKAVLTTRRTVADRSGPCT